MRHFLLGLLALAIIGGAALKKVIILFGITVLFHAGIKAQNCIDTLIWKVDQQYFGGRVYDGTPLNAYTRTYFKNTLPKDDFVSYSFSVRYFGSKQGRFEHNTERLHIGRSMEVLFNDVWTEIPDQTSIVNGNPSYSDFYEENVYEGGYDWMMCFACFIDKDGYSLPAKFRMIVYIDSSSMDGKFCDSIVKLSADTAYYTIIDGDTLKNKINVITSESISIFPNPAKLQIRVTNTQDAVLRLYNTLGQEVLQTHSMEENTIINTSYLPQGLYVLKVEKGNAILTRKIQIVK
jgi:hypothetical protein